MLCALCAVPMRESKPPRRREVDWDCGVRALAAGEARTGEGDAAVAAELRGLLALFEAEVPLGKELVVFAALGVAAAETATAGGENAPSLTICKSLALVESKPCY